MESKNHTSSNSDLQFDKLLQKRIRAYFKENNISKYGNSALHLKTLFMLSLYVVPFLLILFYIENRIAFYLAWAIMGIGVSGISFSTIHDANHNAYSKNKTINTWLSYLLNFIGGDYIVWRIQHNVLHHSYTNIDGLDDDIDAGILLRLSPHQEKKPFHKFQHIYAWFLYGLLTLNWVVQKDFKQIQRYHALGLVETQNISFPKAFSTIIISKLLYCATIIGLPILLSSFPWYEVLLGFFIMHFLLGLSLSLVFQSAHVLPMTNFLEKNDNEQVVPNWSVHQLETTCNFATNNKTLTWFLGGLNFQIEHHLFPGICHIHYKDISKIVKETASEYNLPYYNLKTFRTAIQQHFMLLEKLGN